MIETDRGEDRGTRNRVSREILHHGPVTATDLAATLGLTPAAVRRHLDTLTDHGLVCTWDPPEGAPRRRGRPARRFVLTDAGHSAMSTAYDDLAVQLLEFLAETAGPEAVRDFAVVRAERLARRYRPAVEAAGENPHRRAGALAQALSTDGYAASVRSLGDPSGRSAPAAATGRVAPSDIIQPGVIPTGAVHPGATDDGDRQVGTDQVGTDQVAPPAAAGGGKQLCQGHCPVQQVAAQFPQLCEAETHAFSTLLGVHVQRLATLAHGEHVCTTHIPPAAQSPARTGTATGRTPANRPTAPAAPDVTSQEEKAADEHRVAS